MLLLVALSTGCCSSERPAVLPPVQQPDLGLALPPRPPEERPSSEAVRAQLEEQRLARQVEDEDGIRAVLAREDDGLAGEQDPVTLRRRLADALVRAESLDALAAWLYVSGQEAWDYAESLERAVQRAIERRRKPRTDAQ